MGIHCTPCTQAAPLLQPHPAMSSTGGDLEDAYEPAVCELVIKDLDEELKILNEATVSYGVWDWRPGKMKYYWGNRNLLKNVYKMSLEQLKVGGRSHAMRYVVVTLTLQLVHHRHSMLRKCQIHS